MTTIWCFREEPVFYPIITTDLKQLFSAVNERKSQYEQHNNCSYWGLHNNSMIVKSLHSLTIKVFMLPPHSKNFHSDGLRASARIHTKAQQDSQTSLCKCANLLLFHSWASLKERLSYADLHYGFVMWKWMISQHSHMWPLAGFEHAPHVVSS